MRNGLKIGALLAVSLSLVAIVFFNYADAQRRAGAVQPGRSVRGSRPDPRELEEIRRRVAAARTPEERTAIMRTYFAQRGASRTSSARPSSSNFAAQPAATNTAENSSTPSSLEDEYPGTGPAIDVEILFVELIADKNGPVRFTGTMADVEKKIRELKTNGKIVSVERLTTTAVDGNKSTSQTGSSQRVLRSTATFGGRAGSSRSYSTQNIGTLVTVIPFIDDDGAISLRLQIEKSWLQGGNGSSGEPGETTPAPTTATVSVNNSVRVRDGRVVTVASSAQESKGNSTQIITLATAKLAEGEKAPAAAAKGPHAARTLKLKNLSVKDAVDTVKQLAPESPITFDFDPVSKILILRGPPKLVGDIVTAVEVLDAQQKPVVNDANDKKSAAKKE